MAETSQVNVVNEGDPVTVGGIFFDTGTTVVRERTLNLLVDLGLLNRARYPFLWFDFSGIVSSPAPGGMVFTGSATASIV